MSYGKLFGLKIKLISSDVNRLLIKVKLPKRNIVEADARRSIDGLVETLMGKKADLRFEYIKNNATSVLNEIDI